MAFTYDATSNSLRFYLNGVTSATLNKSLYDYNINTFDIGGNSIGGTTTKTSFNGLIDEVSIYNRALTDTEVKAIYDAGSAGKIKP